MISLTVDPRIKELSGVDTVGAGHRFYFEEAAAVGLGIHRAEWWQVPWMCAVLILLMVSL